jgi:hypothetical protein
MDATIEIDKLNNEGATRTVGCGANRTAYVQMLASMYQIAWPMHWLRSRRSTTAKVLYMVKTE